MTEQKSNPPPNSTISLKIKTIDNKQHEIRIPSHSKILRIKQELRKETGLQISQQKLIFRGRLLSDSETLKNHEIRDGHTLNLVARMTVHEHVPPPPSQPSNPTPQNQPREQEVFSRILRTLNDNSTSRSNQRRKALQQRTFGFPFNEMESLEIIRQNLVTIGQLMHSKSKGPSK